MRFVFWLVLLAAAGPLAGQVGVPPNGGPADSVVAAAARAVDGGRPWTATRLLARLVQDSATRTRPVVITAARAASRWEGWGSVVRLLGRAAWLDADGGAGWELLARAQVEQSDLGPAVTSAARAVALSPAESRGERQVILARALDRAGQLDSAARVYASAGESLTSIRDWLLLRAAGVTVDSAARARIYQAITNSTARARIPWTEALAFERSGELRSAAGRYAALGARLAAIRTRVAAAKDPTSRKVARAELVALLGPDLPLGDTEAAIGLFDREWPKKTPDEELRVARRAALANVLDRAARGYAAAGLHRLTDRDRFAYATVLSRLGRYAEAAPLFDGVKTEELKGDAAYQKARMLVRGGQADRAVDALVSVPVKFPSDSEPAAAALFLAGDLKADAGADDSARSYFHRAYLGYPRTSYGRRAGFQAALIAFLDRDFAAAAAEFDQLAAEPNADESLAASYWAGRALEAAGDSSGARRRWRRTLERGRDSYYALVASRRLDTTLFQFPIDSTPDPERPEPAALARARLLARLGLKIEAKLEVDAFASGPAPFEPIAAALADGQWYARAMRVAERALERGEGSSRRLFELVYPMPFRQALLSEAHTGGLDPALVAGVIRQESLFDPEARSVADARGLMQVLPSVGAQLARSLGIEWDPVLLFQPDVNLNFGVDHLRAAVQRLEWPARAVAAFNAGVDRVVRWQTIRGVDVDPEIFIERIPFAETRDYVRKVLRNQALYQALYRPA